MRITEEHRLLRESLLQLIGDEINPHVEEWEEAGIFPSHEVFKKLGDAGFLGITKDEEYGGAGLDWTYEVLAAECLGHIRCGGVPMAIGVQAAMCTPALERYASEELKRDFLAPTIAGDLVGCIGISESGAGSDVASVRTTARRVGGDYVIRGEKMWITNGWQADWMCALVNTGEGAPHRNKSLLVVPLDTHGVERSRKLDKLGMWSSDTAQLFFDDVRVPARCLIGEEGMGFAYQMEQFQEERLWAAANSLAGMEDVIDATIEHTRERKAFGRSILDNQVVYFRIGELKTEVEALRSLVYRATEQMVAGDDVTRLASMAKLKAGRLAREVSDACLQYWGGQGYMWESLVARSFRDSRLLSIGGGADEIMLEIIAKYEGILPRAEA
ncbi:MAG: acyl-CoA dehydrogenase family protein [Thermoanaerobaculia bacterium]|nr:acyl-CoA dehydrogenase family protein [Thermoanaerobaculia bacterium]